MHLQVGFSVREITGLKLELGLVFGITFTTKP